MSKIKPDKINFNEDDFVVAVENTGYEPSNISEEAKKRGKEKQEEISKTELEKNRLEAMAAEIIGKAEQKAKEITDTAQDEKKEIISEAENILNSAKEEADKKLDEANKEKTELIETSKEEIEKQRAQSANEGYQEGYKDGESKLYEELEEKIEGFNNFCKNQYEIKNKIIKSASKDILDIIINISRKILLKEVDGEALKKIIEKTITLFEEKENINILLSEKYAKLLFEYQKKSLNDEQEFNFEDFKQFDNFNILYNPKLNEDTIIIENPKERYDASINAQLDIIIRDILESTSNGQIEVEIAQTEEQEKNEAE